MVGGFTFNGVDIDTLGLSYAPELADTFVYKPATMNIYEEVYDGHDGGYFYGASRKPKEFILRCYYEEEHINKGVMTKLFNVFKIGTSGKLVFKKRPWCYYYATVTDVDIAELLNYENGLIKISMKAYYPFARSESLTIDPESDDYEIVSENSGLSPNTIVLPSGEMTCPITEETSIELYNPGTEAAPVRIEIAGDVGAGVIIRNETNGTECKYVAMGAQKFNGNSYVYTDGISGKTMSIINGEKALAFMYHDHGFLMLDPCVTSCKAVDIQSSITVRTQSVFDENFGEASGEPYIGRYVYCDEKFRKITAAETNVSSRWTNFTVDPPTPFQRRPEHVDSVIVTGVNKISIIPETTMNLLRLNFIYQPTFA